MAVTKETIDQVRKMPHILGRIRNELLNHDPDQNTEAAITAILEEEQYPLSKRQQETLSIGLPVFERDHAALQYSLKRENNERLREALAKSHKINIDDIALITFHPTSVTFSITSDTFSGIWKKWDGSASGILPIGFTNNNFVVQLDQRKIRYSLRDKVRSDSTTAKHENQHIVYRYTHPFLLEAIPNNKELKKYANEDWIARDLKRFRADARYLSFFQMYIYLDELAATSLRRQGVIDQFIGDSTDTYVKGHQDRINAMRSGLPYDSAESLAWEKVIWDETKALNHKIQFVETEYLKLIRSGMSTEDIRNIIQVLTPDQAYLIRLFNPENQSVTISDFYSWAREYFNGRKSETQDEKLDDLTSFLVSALDSENMELLPSTYREFLGRVRTRKRNLIAAEKYVPYDNSEYFSAIPFDINNIQSVIETIKGIVTARATYITGAVNEYIDQQPLLPEEKEKVRIGLIQQAFNFPKLFYRFVDGYDAVMNHNIFGQTENVEVFGKITQQEQVILAKRALELDDAMDDMMESYKNGQVVDFERLFTPGYQRSDEKYERLMQFILNNPIITTNLAFPADDESSLKVVSPLLRILLWEKQRGVLNDKNLSKIKKYLRKMRKLEMIPSIYEPLIKEYGLLPETTTPPTSEIRKNY